LRQGIQQAELTGDFKQVTENLHALGLLHLNRGQYNKSAEAFQQGLEKARKTKNAKLEGDTLRGLGRFTMFCNYPRPWKISKRPSRLRKERQEERRSRISDMLGQLFFKCGKHERATNLFEQALGIARKQATKTVRRKH